MPKKVRQKPTKKGHSVVASATGIAMGATKMSDLAAPAVAGDALRKGTRVTVSELPAMTDEKIWKGTGANVEEVDMPAAGATLTVAETQVFSGTSPTVWTDLNLSSVVGSNKAWVFLKIYCSTEVRNLGFRANGETELVAMYPAESVSALQLYPTTFGMLLVHTDASGIVEWKVDYGIAGFTVDVVAYIK